MARSRPEYLVDEKGRKKAVLLSIKEYLSIIRRLEELEDALELDEARTTAGEFRDYRDIRRELKEEGLL